MTSLAPSAAAHGTGDDPCEYTFPADIVDIVKFNANGLIPAVMQEEPTGRALMMARMDSHTLAYTIVTKRSAYQSWFRSEYWIKGLASGHFQTVVSPTSDCNGGTMLMQVVQDGAVYHTGSRSCFDVHPVFEDRAVNPDCRSGDFVVKHVRLR